MGWRWRLYWGLVVVIMMEVGGGHAKGGGGGVTYDGRSLIIDGKRKILFLGSIHYPRSTPQMWPSLIAKAKKGGLDVIQTYVFWNLHEPQPGQYDFKERYDLVRFIKNIQAQGMYVCLRIGPFIESEWNYGGFPFWLHDVPGIFHMQNFTTKIVNLMKSEGLYASQGGPIILSQIENEYQNIEAAFHEKGPPYVRWATKMAVGLKIGVPWVMCKQTDFLEPVVSAKTFRGPNSPNKPSLWTENWTSKSAENIAFYVALFIARNGSYVNYYMYHGGTNFGRTSSAYIRTAYYDQAPLDEYRLIRQPKWSHLKELHAAIKLCSTTLLHGVRRSFSLGEKQEVICQNSFYAIVFEGKKEGCAAFLINNDTHNNAVVQFQNISFKLLPKSISILPNCKKITFNTAQANIKYNNRIIIPVQTFDSSNQWKEFKDVIVNFKDTSLKSKRLLEQTSTTKDKSDYLWHTLRFQHNLPCTKPILHVESLAHVARAFLNNIYIGRASRSMDIPVMLNKGMNNISILSIMVGLQDSGAYLESKVTGLTTVEIQCNKKVLYDFRNYEWGYKVGLLGEELKIYKETKLGDAVWSKKRISTNQILTWYKIFFNAPKGNDPIALNLSSMGKGETWVNGQSIGRYWISFHDSEGKPSQIMYHMPRSFLKASGNLLVLLEEAGGNPLQISLNTVSITNA
ncbi:hypothetical protein ACJW30_04G049100 [Castanea mollissima]